MNNEEIENEDSGSEELFEHYRFTADPGQEVLRIDKFLMDRIPNTSRNKVQIAAKNGNILVNTIAVKQNYKIKPNDEISIVLPFPVREIELIAQDIPLSIAYEDEEHVVVNKPADMVVHPGYGNYSGTLVNALVYHFDNLPSKINEYSHQSFTTSLLNFIMGTAFLVILLFMLIALGPTELVPLPAGPWWIYTGGTIGVIYIAFTSTIVQHLGVLTFTLFSVGGQLVGSLVIDLISPTNGVNVSAYLVTGIVMTYLGVIAGGVSSSRVQKPKRL